MLKKNTLRVKATCQIYLCISSMVLSIPLSAQWVQQGPAPARGGQVENIHDQPVTGAINCVTPHPTNANILYVGAVNGGVWRTRNALDNVPDWEFISGDLPSQAIGALEFDRSDQTHQTLVVAIGRTSSFGGFGSGQRGVFRTTNGVGPWTDLDPGDTFANLDISGLAVRDSIIVVSTANGIYRTKNLGTTWSRVSGITFFGLPAGRADDLVADPKDPAVLYTHAGGTGIYRSADTGANWRKVSTAAVDRAMASASRIEFAVGLHKNLFVAIVTGRQLSALFMSPDAGATWKAMDLPTTVERNATIGIHPGMQGHIHLSLAADPIDANAVYIGGDRQPWATEPIDASPYFPNASGARDFTGRLFRVDAALSSGKQATPITHMGTGNGTAPHADSRDMAFDANGDLLEGDDGGVYKQTAPADSLGDWVSLNGNINAGEIHSADWDAVSHIIISGFQDNGVKQQERPTNISWQRERNGDGGDVAVDDVSSVNSSTRYASSQELSSFSRAVYSSGNVHQSTAYPNLTNTATGKKLTEEGTVFGFVNPIKLNKWNGQRLLLSTDRGIFESLDQGHTVTNVSPRMANEDGADAMAYGARNNEHVIYLGSGNDVWIRDGPQPDNFILSNVYPGGFVRGLDLDPGDFRSAYVIDDNNVFETTNAGAGWGNITGNLARLNPGTLRSVAYIPDENNDMLAVGSDLGVYLAPGPGFNNWSALGTNLPRVAVLDLEYDTLDQVLLAGTMGRGAWTWSFAERDPVDIALVLDLSGSMLRSACPGCATKLDVLKDAVEIFMQLWKGIAVTDDRIGAVYFRSRVTSYQQAGQMLLPVIDETDDVLANLRSQTTTWPEMTAMGGGLQVAINEMTDQTRLRNIILFTDGMQNLNPAVVFPGLSIEDGVQSRDANVNATAPVTVMNKALGIKINTIGVGATPAFESQLTDIALGTGGVIKITTAPNEDLRRFFVEELIDVLRKSSPQLVAYRKGTFEKTSSEAFQLNATATQVLFKVSYQRGDEVAVSIFKGKQDVTRQARVIDGAFYQIFVFPFEQLNALSEGSTSSAGEWSVRLTSGNGKVNYEVAAITDEASIAYELTSGTGPLYVGDPVPLAVEVWVYDILQHENVSVTALVDRPQTGLGTLLSTTRIPDAAGLSFEPNQPTGARQYQQLREDPGFIRRMAPIQDQISLTPGADRRFTAEYGTATIPGTYRVTFVIEGDHPHTGPYRRTEMRSFVVRFAQFDLPQSDVQVSQKETGNDAYTWTWTFTPRDSYGNYLGPDYEDLLEISSRDGAAGNLRYLGKGRYAFDVSAGEARPHVMIRLYDEVWYDDTMPTTKRTFYYSLHTGLGLPTGDMDQVYNPGLYGKLDLERFVTDQLSLVFTMGSYTFNSDLNVPFGTFHVKGYLPLGQSAFSLHGEAGMGVYRLNAMGNSGTEGGFDAGLGLNYTMAPVSRLSLDWNQIRLLGNSGYHWMALGIGYHHRF